MARSSNPSNSESPSSSRSPSGEEREETEFLADESPVEEEDDVPENGPPEEEILDECFSGKCKACIPCVPCHSRDDSIWSFHVWNEMYFSRGKETTNGWQTLDATPQELSNGKFQMGPASVKEVQNGTSDCYDTDFVIGEVNGDIKLYVYNVPDLNEKTKIRAMDKGDFVLHNGDPLFLGFRWYTDPFGETYNNVGFKIVTKKPGPIARKCVKNSAKCQMEELDLTPTYKQCPDAQDRQMPFCAVGYQINKATCADPGKTMLSLLEQKEANLLEDTAFRQAGKIHELTGSHVKDVEATFDDFVPKYVEINHDLPLQITFKNRGGEKRKVNIAISAMGMDYRGLPVIHMETRRKKYAMKLPIEGEQTLLQRSVVLEPYESQTFQYVVPAENLDEDLLESLEVNAAQGNFFLQFHVSAHVEETGQTFARQPRRSFFSCWRWAAWPKNMCSLTVCRALVPTTFNEMFLFNAAVMGFSSSIWMQFVLDQFDNIVTNVANSYRLQEECDVLTLVLAKHRGPIKLPEFKAVMLASLRSLLPKDWDTHHEVAWNWLWENVERMLRSQINPKVFEEALERFVQSIDEDALMSLRQGIYKEFFAVAPSGQDYFKQSTTRLYFIADKMIEITCGIYKEPRVMVEDISALGLRHVAYEIPTELFSPFVSSAVKVLGEMTTDETATASFRWSLNLVSKILVRTLLEGSTIVMKAINRNEQKALQKAIAVAPRGKRAMELLEIRVGTQTISPFYWAIESGSLNSAKAMISDLLTIRADRDNYYYGCDDLFRRHPEVVHKLCVEAPTMLTTLLDGLLWRARKTVQGTRRVNYYVKHLLQDDDGSFDQALEWLVDFNCPKIISHPVVVLFTDMLWTRVAMYYFLIGRLYFFITLSVFAFSQALLPSTDGAMSKEGNVAVFICRCFIYLGSMCHLLIRSIRLCYKDIRDRNFSRIWRIPVPEHLCCMTELGYIALFWTLLMMCIQEPIWWCLNDPSGDGLLFTSNCDGALYRADSYAALSCVAMLLYCALIINLSILSMRISSFVMMCGRVLAEVGLFLMAACFLIISFALGISALSHRSSAFQGLDNAAYSLFAIMSGLFPASDLDQMQDEIGVIITVSIFVIFIAIFLLNLLVAQLNQAYQIIFPDMQGYARLTRASVIVSAVEHASTQRWTRFLQGLHFDQRLEFEEGDVGLAGGIQVTEPSWAHPTTVDSIRRFGGSTSPEMPWPEDERLLTDDDRFERLEKLILRCTKGKKKRGEGTGDSSMRSGTGTSEGSYKSDSSNNSE